MNIHSKDVTVSVYVRWSHSIPCKREILWHVSWWKSSVQLRCTAHCSKEQNNFGLTRL